MNNNPLGVIGNSTNKSQIIQEYVANLQGIHAANVYNKMRRSDTQIGMILKAINSPIVNAKLSIEPCGKDDDSLEICDFVNHILNSIGTGTDVYSINAKRHEILTYLAFGFSLFEIVHKSVKNDKTFGDYIGIKDLAFRPQQTIMDWIVDEDENLIAIKQTISKNNIPSEYLLHFTNDQEGNNFEGISILRNTYGSWLRVQDYYETQLLGLNKSATGTPILKVENLRNSTDSRYLQAKAAMDDFTAGKSNYIILPKNYELEMYTPRHDAKALNETIKQEYTQIAKSILASHLEMGTGGSGGAYSLGTDISDGFLSIPQGATSYICEKIKNKLVKPLVVAKYGLDAIEFLPEIKYVGINDKAGQELSNVLSQLTSAGYLDPEDEVLKQFIRKSYNLPEQDIDDEKTDDKKTDDESIQAMQFAQSVGQKVKKQMDNHQKVLKNIFDDFYSSNIKLYANKLNTANQQNKSLLKVEFPNKSKLLKQIQIYSLSIAKEASKQALVGSGLTIKNLNKGFLKLATKKPIDTKIKQDSDIRVQGHINKIAEAMILTAQSIAIDSAIGVDSISAAANNFISDKAINTIVTNAVSAVTNMARNDVFLSPDVEKRISSYIFTNPDPDSDICKNLSDRVFSVSEFRSSGNLPPLHHNCKSIVVPQYTTQKKPIKPINPLGLTPAGTKKELLDIYKSKTFK
jgi:hypothetical protein